MRSLHGYQHTNSDSKERGKNKEVLIQKISTYEVGDDYRQRQ